MQKTQERQSGRLGKTEALRKLQAAEFGILEDFSAFCEANGIDWFLHSGTALGAARHGGFIPWDDDIDVAMPRDQFEKFMDIARSDREFMRFYIISTPETDQTQAALFPKIMKRGTLFATEETLDAGFDQGIFIDIFPLDALSDDAKERRKQIRNAMIWQSLSYIRHSSHVNPPHKGLLSALESTAFKAAQPIVRRMLEQETINRGFKRSLLPEDAGSQEWMNLYYPHYSYPKDIFVPTGEAEFQGIIFPVPGKLDEYLSITYGDWRKLPEEKDRKSHLPLFIDFGDGSYYDALE